MKHEIRENYEERLDQLFLKAFDTDHPAMLDWVLFKMDVKKIKQSLAFYKKRVEELEQHKKEFSEPNYTLICNILANGKIRP